MLKTLIPQVNRYMFNKKESIVVKPEKYFAYGFASQYEQTKVVAVMLCNLHELGYTIPHDELPRLFNMTPDELNDLVYKPLLEEAKEAKGAHVEHRILFTGFPDSVKELDIDTLSDIRFMSYFTTVIDKFMGYDALSDGSINKTFVEDAIKQSLDEAAKQSGQASWSHALDAATNERDFFKVAQSVCQDARNDVEGEKKTTTRAVHLVYPEAYYEMVKNMLSARTSLSAYDQEIVKFTIDNFDKEHYMPAKIQFRETQALVDTYNFNKGHNIDIRTMADYERLLISLSGGDTSSSKKQMIRNFSNQERKRLFEIFSNALQKNYPTMLESAANRQTLRTMDNVLKNRLHFNKMTAVDERGRKVMGYNEFLKRAQDHESVMAIYEHNLREKNYAVAAKILAKHSPTLMIQHARELLGKTYTERDNANNLPRAQRNHTWHKYHSMTNSIAKTIEECAKKVDIKTLLNLHREAIKNHEPYKIMFPKGSRLDVIVKENKSQVLSVSARVDVLAGVVEGLKYQIENQIMEGKVQINKGTKVYVDPNLADCPIPTVGRSDAGKNRTVAPGTKLPVEQGEILRAALYKQHDHDQFIDFSCGFLDENYKMVGQVSWNNLQQKNGGKMIAYHSGDTMACSGKGCTEIIDIDLTAAKESFPAAKYVAYTAVMWESKPLSSCNQLFMALAPAQEMGKEKGKAINTKLRGDNATKFAQACGQYEVYDPANVQFKVDITGDGYMSIPMLYDIDTGKAMIVNIDTKIKDLHVLATNQRHFDLPQGCECLENYSTDLAIKCFAYSKMDIPTIKDLADLYVMHRGAETVQTPGEADVIFATDRIQVEDVRPRKEGDELVEQVVLSPFDKDLITAELIPDPKAIEVAQQMKRIEINQKEMVNHDDFTHDDFTHDDFGRDI